MVARKPGIGALPALRALAGGRAASIAVLAIAAALTAEPAGASAGPPAGPRHGAAPCVSFAPLTALYAVTATSPGDVWAVGSMQTGPAIRALTEHWNGTAWTRVPSPGGSHSLLSAVAATSARDAWAVGNAKDALIEHWNGAAWSTVAQPNGPGALLSGVAATSARDAWAAGLHVAARGPLPVIDHWNGTRWQRVSSPPPAGASGGALFGLAATSPSAAWAVGYSFQGRNPSRTWAERWNGTTWAPVPTPSPKGRGAEFLHVAAASAASAWAVGDYFGPAGAQHPLAEHWDGTAWTVVPVPLRSGGGRLSGVAVTAPADAWAVGASCTAGGHTRTLIERWNGTAWTPVPSPNAPHAADSSLAAVTAISARDAWAVGWSASGIASGLLIEHWNGKAWAIVPVHRARTTPPRREGCGARDEVTSAA